jgi:hypothetical protein
MRGLRINGHSYRFAYISQIPHYFILPYGLSSSILFAFILAFNRFKVEGVYYDRYFIPAVRFNAVSQSSQAKYCIIGVNLHTMYYALRWTLLCYGNLVNIDIGFFDRRFKSQSYNSYIRLFECELV